MKPLRSRLEVIQKLKSPTMIKGCRSFAGMVNFVSIFCPEHQKLLKPIYDLTRKGRQLIWGEEQESAFQEIKSRLQKSPVLHLPICQIKREDSNCIQIPAKIATGSHFYPIQNSKPKLIAYVSKRLPETATNHSIMNWKCVVWL